MKTVAHINREKYLKAPTWEEIDSFLKSKKIKMSSFEKFYGLPESTLRHVKTGTRELPAKFWHIIYNQIVPSYGVGFLEPVDNTKRYNFVKNILKKPNQAVIVTNEVTKEDQQISVSSRLSDLLK